MWRLYQSFFMRNFLILLIAILGVMIWIQPAQADSVEPYLRRYLQVTEPVPLKINEQGETRLFSPNQISEGKSLFLENCMNCHVGGSNLPVPSVTLSMENLKGATPPRDNINALVAYLRHPTTYDGMGENFWCREVPDTWLSTEKVENLSAFLLRSAEKAPGWGSDTFGL